MKCNKNSKGAITLEAAIIVPIFIIMMLLVNGLFVMFMGQQIMSHTLVQSAKSLAYDPYSSQLAASDKKDQLQETIIEIFTFNNGNHSSTEKWYDEQSIDETVKKRFIAYLRSSKEDTDGLLDEIGVKNGLDGLDFSGSSIDKDRILTVKLKYTQEFIFNAAGLGEFEREIYVKVKLFEYGE